MNQRKNENGQFRKGHTTGAWIRVPQNIRQASIDDPESFYIYASPCLELDCFDTRWEAEEFLRRYIKRGKSAYGTAIGSKGHIVNNGKVVTTITKEDIEEDDDGLPPELEF